MRCHYTRAVFATRDFTYTGSVLALALARTTRAVMSAVVEKQSAGATGPEPTSGQLFRNCWSCRLLSGGGLLLSGAYVFNEARKVMRKGGPISMGTVAQITFAASIAAWGIVIITDPVGKSQRKT